MFNTRMDNKKVPSCSYQSFQDCLFVLFSSLTKQSLQNHNLLELHKNYDEFPFKSACDSKNCVQTNVFVYMNEPYPISLLRQFIQMSLFVYYGTEHTLFSYFFWKLYENYILKCYQ